MNPLNPGLYDRLGEVFGEVRICNDGVPASLRRMPVASIFTGPPRAGADDLLDAGETYRVCCPFCEDRNWHLYVPHVWGSYAEVDGNPVQFSRGLAHCFRRGCLKNGRNWSMFADAMTSGGGGLGWRVDKVRSGQNEAAAIPLPVTFTPLSAMVAPGYIRYYVEEVRKFTLEDLASWGVGLADVNFYSAPSLVFPVRMHGEHRFWQARWPFERPDMNSAGLPKPKYYIPPAAKKSWVLYNFDRASLYRDVVLVEGVLDCIRVGGCGVAMFGSRPSEAQLKLLYGAWGRGSLVWIPDADDPAATAKAESLVAEWNERGLFEGGAKIVKTGQGDPATFGKEELWSMLQSQTGLSLEARSTR